MSPRLVLSVAFRSDMTAFRFLRVCFSTPILSRGTTPVRPPVCSPIRPPRGLFRGREPDQDAHAAGLPDARLLTRVYLPAREGHDRGHNPEVSYAAEREP